MSGAGTVNCVNCPNGGITHASVECDVVGAKV